MFSYSLQPNETLVIMHRQTEWILFKPLVIILLGIYLPWYFLIKYELVGSYQRLLLLWTIVLLAYGLIKYFLWLLSVYIITNKKIILVRYQNLFNKKISEHELATIVHVGTHTKGVAATMFDYGDVKLQMANVEVPIEIKHVRHPQTIKELIWETRARLNQGQKKGLEVYSL